MQIQYKELTNRTATINDAEQLCTWWNDGSVMAHAGFPNGLGTTTEIVAKQIKENPSRHMIIYQNKPIGEMNYSHVGDNVCEIGIKICDFSKQNKGIGKVVLSLFIIALFDEMHYKRILLDTNLKNERAQHVYEQLGFKKIRINIDSWKDQLGNLQSSVDYELIKDNFISYI